MSLHACMHGCHLHAADVSCCWLSLQLGASQLRRHALCHVFAAACWHLPLIVVCVCTTRCHGSCLPCLKVGSARVWRDSLSATRQRCAHLQLAAGDLPARRHPKEDSGLALALQKAHPAAADRQVRHLSTACIRVVGVLDVSEVFKHECGRVC